MWNDRVSKCHLEWNRDSGSFSNMGNMEVKSCHKSKSKSDRETGPFLMSGRRQSVVFGAGESACKT